MNNLTQYTLATGNTIMLNAVHIVSIADGPNDAVALIRMVNGDQWAVRV